MKIIGLRIKNIMGVSAVDVDTKDMSVIKFEGKCKAGKTTVINSFIAALKGMKYLGKNTLRDGEDEGFVQVVLADPDSDGFDEKRDTLIVERFVNKKGDRLKVSSPNGATYKSPAKMLDELCTAISIDPLKFKAMDDKARIDALLELTGDADKAKGLDTQRDKLYQGRRDVNRDAKEFKAKVGDAMVSGTDKLGQEKKTAEVAGKLADERSRVDRIESRKTRLNEVLQSLSALNAEREELEREVKDNDGESQVDRLQEELNTVDDFNQGVRSRNQAIADVIELNILEGKSQALTGQIEKIDSDKAKILSTLPISGVTMSDEGLRIDGRIVDDMCGYEAIEIGIQIAAAMNPTLRIITIQAGAELDKESWAKVDEFAKKREFQVMAAVVADEPSLNSFYIEAGKIA